MRIGVLGALAVLADDGTPVMRMTDRFARNIDLPDYRCPAAQLDSLDQS